jgi:hypothetical protein
MFLKVSTKGDFLLVVVVDFSTVKVDLFSSTAWPKSAVLLYS